MHQLPVPGHLNGKLEVTPKQQDGWKLLSVRQPFERISGAFRAVAGPASPNQIVPGVGIAVQMILTAMALVAGILISNILLPVRRR